MLSNYIKMSLRNLGKQKFYSFLNIFGLTIGLITSLLIIFYVLDEYSYDRFHQNADRIHRVTIKGRLSGQDFDGATSCAPFAATVIEEIPEVKEAVRINLWTNIITKYKDKSFTEKQLLLADSNFFKFFTFKLAEGDPGTVLKGPNKIVITKSMAKKYFGYDSDNAESPIGKMMQVGNGDRICEVSGIAEDPPTNSHFHFDMLMSMDSWEYSKNSQWTSNSFHTYILLDEKADWRSTESKFNSLVEKYVGPEVEEFLGLSLEKFKEQGGAYGYYLQSLTDIHLKSNLKGELEPNGNITYLFFFSIIAIFIIIIACINFMNLSTARAANRAKEVGVRKAVGALKQSLIKQFLTESMMYSVFSTVLALIFIQLILPFFNILAGKELSTSSFVDLKIIAGLGLLTFFIGLLAGSYPALYLTSFRPAEVLKGKVKAGFKSKGIRSTLVVFQFTISIFLIISTLLVYKQLNLMQNKSLGLDKENVLVINNASQLKNNLQAFKNSLKSYEEIKSVSVSNLLPPHIDNNTVFRPYGKDDDHLLTFYRTDNEHLKTLDLKMAAGRFFSEEFPSDSSAVILNETAMKQIGWDNHQEKKLMSYFDSEDGTLLNVIGVVRDFNFESLKNNVEPLAIIFGEGNLISVKISGQDVPEKINLIKSQWKEYAPDAPFEFSFLDENFDLLYRSEQRMSKIFLIFTSLAILIACLGLLGLAAFTAEQKAKEIGIRKVLGATVPHLVFLMSKEFTKLVLISFLLAIPLSYWAIDQWLQGFAYKINIQAITFLIGGIISIVIAWLTIGYQSFKAAASNPVNSLKTE